ncbi:hypothetical protein BXT89_14350 [Halopseudomonas pachastrellae]|uniref:Biotin protein ligase C-terminal domain-containing protein n=1 Tax=Halopseudomonas pachastrellae TaxID=254161 RepID=A0A1S8DDT1_9GAMM|nr:hypothetical protein [Halopseudomonas pachastrellae]ONM43131.1 hypothetical protein BXT89_14350 [Halopseudomonas pachastrellae]SFL71200.1 hypothetical protein SAMN05216256_10193 [Halopseudomonas pachastrellae]
MSIEFLRSHAKRLSEFAKETELKAKANPDDFFLQIAAKNQRDAAASVRSECALSTAERNGALVDLRLIGPRADGSVSLETFVKAMHPFVNACKLAAYKIRNGQEAASRVSREISSTLNIKLAGLAPGSTHILMTGNASPDLTGESLFNETIKQLFELLNSDNASFYDSIDTVGGKAAHHISELMKSLDSAGLAAELSWNGPGGRRVWAGRPDEIVRVRALIEAVQEPTTFDEKIEGTVAGIRDTGRLHVRTDDGMISIRYPLKLTKEVQLLRISSPAVLNVKTTRYWDAASKQHVSKRRLISVVP